MNKKILGIFLFAAFMVSSVWAQGRKGLRINEVLVTNENNYQDDYGCQSAWIEIFNTTFGTVDVRSCYLTNDKNNPKKYPIPKGDVLTEMPPRQHVLFWADGKPNRGTFHVNFTLDPDKDNWIGLYDSNGRDLIDSVTVPAGIPTDHSYARYEDGVGHWVIKGGNEQSGYVTPSTNNITLDKNVKIDMFTEHDPFGVGMAIMAMAIVFAGLLLLYLLFRLIGQISVLIKKRNAMRVHGISDKEEAKEKGFGREAGEVYAAIAMALYQHLEAHDVEDTILTINKVKKAYSPWNSKIYSLREIPSKK
ncbi:MULTISPECIES: OadG family transporter subunit [Barnesiella]|uniref:OadG family transporter subunit n=1 Tax=Barnesiella TaxID=397864 RepID=UPI000B379215|nr:MULTISPECIES: OadG family transporter subunit [Barnesiella]MCR8910408.1 OadG family transporter subunit [Barnesiella sp. ET7]MDM8268028.1 OadG family transporter subunit [Barnesiella viscericola]OUO98567.1 phage tail protein [Barnesiella sp. An22]HJB73528.1 lamin tail domain-containing protein [Candidatus Barnesiella merdigallinarum]